MAVFGKIDYQQALLNASKGMIRVKDPVILLRLITRFIDRQIGATHVGVLLLEKAKDSFILIDSKGVSGKRIPIRFVRITKDNPIVLFFQQKKNGLFNRKDALVMSELEHMKNFEIYVNKREKTAVHLDDIRHHMDLFGACICIPSFYKRDLVGIMVLGEKLTGQTYEESEISLFVTLANDVAMAVKNAELIRDLTDAYEKEHTLLIQTASSLVAAIEARDKYTKGHSERVSHYTLVVAMKLIEKSIVEPKRDFLEAAQLGGLLHDVGKIGIKDEILNKPAALNYQEYSIMKSHVKIGSHILEPITALKGVHDGVLYHHERWDGLGYPHGLKGVEIPIIGRIVSIVDSYDTMVTERPYAKRMTPDEAIEKLKAAAGTQFDPMIVDLFEEAYNEGSHKKRLYKAFKFTRRN
jgi:HD-GYP domain-containing protein (c-di-GMP phosphodiesterase class II)